MANFSTFYYNALKRKTEPKRKFRWGRHKGQPKPDRERTIEKPATRYATHGQEFHATPGKSDAPNSSTYTVAG